MTYSRDSRVPDLVVLVIPGFIKNKLNTALRGAEPLAGSLSCGCGVEDTRWVGASGLHGTE